MIERLYDNSKWSPRYSEAMKTVIAALDDLNKRLGHDSAEHLEALSEAYAQVEKAAALDAFTEGFCIACGTGTIMPHLYLPQEGYSNLACLPEESFPTRAACVREAEARLRALYSAAEKTLAKYSDPSSPDSLLTTFQAELSKRLLAQKELLGSLRSPATAAIVNRVNACLSPAGVFEEMGRFNDTLRNQYALKPVHDYLSHIDYSVSDPSDCVEGPWKLIALAFRRYGYDLLPAIHALEADGSGALAGFQRAFEAKAAQEVRTHIIAPVQDKLPLLRQALCGSGQSETGGPS